MPNNTKLDHLVSKILSAIEDHIAGKEDRHGFSKLDLLLGEVAEGGGVPNSKLESALLQVIPKLKQLDDRCWEALRMLVEAAKLRSRPLSVMLTKLLDEMNVPVSASARFQTFLAVRALGGALTRPRLEKETKLYNELRPQWADLVISTLKEMPENVVAFLEEQLKLNERAFTPEDVRRRLPFLFRTLGEKFNQSLVRITHAIPNQGEREKFSRVIKKNFKIDPLAEAVQAIPEGSEPPTTSRNRRGILPRRYRRSMSATSVAASSAFDAIVSEGMRDMKRQRSEQIAAEL